MAQSPKCGSCGAEIRPGDRVITQCEYCGAVLPSPVQPRPLAPQPRIETTPRPTVHAYRGKTRGIAGGLCLTMLTFGIYSIVWFIGLAGDLGKAKPESGISPGKDLLLGIVTLGIYSIYCMYKYPKVMAEIQKDRGLPVHDFAVLSLVLALFGLYIIPWCMMQAELNKIWAADGGVQAT